MADLAPARAPKKLDLADTERRKVIMEHELFVMFTDQSIDLLFVRRGPECRYYERLGFPAGKQSRTVSPWSNFDLAGDRPDIFELAAIDAALSLNDQATETFPLEFVERTLDILFLLWKLRQHLSNNIAFDFTDLFVAFQFLWNLDGLLQLRQCQLLDLPNNRWIQFSQRHLTLRLADLSLDFFLNLQKRLESLMSGE